MTWMLLLPLAILPLVFWVLRTLDVTCGAELDRFDRHLHTVHSSASIAQLEADLTRYRNSKCRFNHNRVRCDAMLVRLRYMRTLAEITHR